MELPNLYALIAGIDNYPTINKLSGCVADAEAVEAFLREAYADAPDRLHILKLTNELATRRGIIEGFEQHLAQAKQGDTAYFHYSGHGSQENAPRPFWKYVSDKKNETIVCYNSRGDGNRTAHVNEQIDVRDKAFDLADKEIAALIELVGKQNPHIVLTFDCCHSGGGSRAGKSSQTAQARQEKDHEAQRTIEDYYGNYAQDFKEKGDVTIPAAQHVLLSACSPVEVAWEDEGHGIFTTNLLKVLHKTGLQTSYGELFEQAQIEIRRQGGKQTPQVETFGEENVWRTFITHQEAPRLYAYPLVYFDGKSATWQLKAGAMQGIRLPKAWEDSTVHLYDANDLTKEVSSGRVVNIKLEVSDIVDLTEPLDETRLYRADINELPHLQIAVHSQTPAFSPDNALHLPNVRWTDEQEADYLVTEQEEGFVMVHLKANKIVEKTKDRRRALEVFQRICRWETLRVLQNEQTELDMSAIEIGLSVYEQGAWGEIALPADGKISFGVTKTILPFRINLKNNAPRNLHVTVLLVSPLFGIRSYGNQSLLEGEELMFFDSSKKSTDSRLLKGFSFLAGQEKDMETDLILKFLVSTERIDEAYLEQDSFSLNLAWKTSGEGRDVMAEAGAISPFDAFDWYAKDITVHLHRQQESLQAGKPAQLSNITLEAGEDFKADISVENIASVSRGVHDHSTDLWKRLLGQEQASLVKAHTQKISRDVGGQEIIVLHNIAGEISAEKPLRIKIHEPLAAHELVLPIGIENGILVPLGLPTDNPQTVEISRLPAQDSSEKSRSLGRALRFCLYKITATVFGTNSDAFFKLRSVRYEGEKAHYEQDAQIIREQVAAAGKILLVIHGIIGNTDDMVAFARKLVERGSYDLILAFDYENLNTEINDIAYQLLRRLVGEERPYTDGAQMAGIGIGADKKIDILAHSMGGLVSRWLIEQRGGNAFVGRLVMCGTPNGGSNFGKIEQFRRIASIGALIAANVFAPFSVVAGLVNVFRGIKAATGSGSIIFKTLGQMDKNSNFLHSLNENGRDGGIPYFVVAGNAHNYLPEEMGVWVKVVDKMLTIIGDSVNWGVPNDIAVLVDDIKRVGKNQNVQFHDIGCHHLNYFMERTSVAKLIEILG